MIYWKLTILQKHLGYIYPGKLVLEHSDLSRIQAVINLLENSFDTDGIQYVIESVQEENDDE